jgi:hypothetical protein
MIGPTVFVSAHPRAVNGDRLFAEGSGQGVTTELPRVRRIVELCTRSGAKGRIAGASGGAKGRIAGASGGFTVECLLKQTTAVTSGTIGLDIVIAEAK